MTPAPCPYPECGAETMVIGMPISHTAHVECPECFARGPECKGPTAAVEAWNRVAGDVAEIAARRKEPDPVHRLHNLCRGLGEPAACGHDLEHYCDHCETCGVCRDEGGPSARGKLDAQIEQFTADLAASIARERALVEALEFYAVEVLYACPPTDVGSEIHQDCGGRARAVLAAAEEGTKP